MLKNSNFFLIGPMGSGKTTIGRQLARSMKKSFHDSDHEIEDHTGASISLIFDIEGEEGFRTREKAIIDELTQQDNIVLSTGGGVILDIENRKNLKDRGTVIYLHASLKKLFYRTSRDKKRPLLQTEDPREKLRQIVEERDPLYRQTADLIVETEGRTVPQVVSYIIRQVQTGQKQTGSNQKITKPIKNPKKKSNKKKGSGKK
ncbi:MAG: shikimate kinase AroK [Gammaproteobacteria bacterium]